MKMSRFEEEESEAEELRDIYSTANDHNNKIAFDCKKMKASSLSSSKADSTRNGDDGGGVITPSDMKSSSSPPPSLSSSSSLRDIAKRMEYDLNDKIKDRTWRTKKYKQCIKNSHAIDWVMKNIVQTADDSKKPTNIFMEDSSAVAIAGDSRREGGDGGGVSDDINKTIQILNKLVNCGYLYHVVDPDKRFVAGDDSVLYFRFARTIHRDASGSQTNGNFSTAKGGSVNNSNDDSNTTLNNDAIRKLQKDVQRLSEHLDKADAAQTESQGQLEVLKQALMDLTTTLVTTSIQVLLLYALVAIYAIFSGRHRHSHEYQWPAYGPHQQNYGHEWNNIGMILIGCTLSLMLIKEGHALWSIWVRINLYLKAMQEGNDISKVEVEESDETEFDDDRYNDDDQVVPEKSSSNRSMRSKYVQSQRRKSLLQMTQESFFQRPSRFSSILGVPTAPSRTVSSDSFSTSSKIKMRDSHELPDVSKWPHRPVMVCLNTPVSPLLTVPKYGTGPCPIGVPFEFESELFEGVCLVRLKNVPSDDIDTDRGYFDGRRRIFQTIVQGRFKEPCLVSDVLTGHEFVRPLQYLPHKWIIQTATSFIGKIAPGASINVHDDQPSVSAILGGTSQVVRGDEPGNQPDIATNFDIQEDCSVLGGSFAESSGLSSSKRKQVLSNPNRSKHYTYDTKSIYTFDFYQNLLDCSTYSLDLGVTKIGLSKVLNGQPIQCLAKHADGRYLWVSVSSLLVSCPPVKCALTSKYPFLIVVLFSLRFSVISNLA